MNVIELRALVVLTLIWRRKVLWRILCSSVGFQVKYITVNIIRRLDRQNRYNRVLRALHIRQGSRPNLDNYWTFYKEMNDVTWFYKFWLWKPQSKWIILIYIASQQLRSGVYNTAIDTRITNQQTNNQQRTVWIQIYTL